MNRVGWAAAASSALLAGLAAASLLAGLQGGLAARPRCYWVGPPLTRYQPALLQRGFLDCRLSPCQLTVRQNVAAGWVCFFARPWG